MAVIACVCVLYYTTRVPECCGQAKKQLGLVRNMAQEHKCIVASPIQKRNSHSSFEKSHEAH